MEQYLRAPLFPYPPVLIITSEASYESTVMEKKYAKTKTKKRPPYAKKRASILPASDSELRPRRSSGVRLAYTDPSGERQRAPSTPRWDPLLLLFKQKSEHTYIKKNLLLFLTFSALVANPKKTTLHGGQSRSWSTEWGGKKEEK